jgi:choline dehydrogenase-like flavoprotein
LDVNSGNPIGIGISPVSAGNGHRCTSASANLKTKQENLEIWTDATVRKVIFDGLQAKGIELLDGRKGFYLLNATK